MTTMSEATEKGYFNALTAGYFKTATDGRKLFFPWGAMGRGYVIPSQQDYERLHRQMKLYTILSLVLIIAPIAWRYYLVGFAVATLLIVFYAGWARYLVRGLQPSEERMSVSDNMATQARTHNTATLWLLEAASLLFVAIGIAMLMIEPGKWIISLSTIVFFGLCAAVLVKMILLNRRAVRGQS